MLTKGVFFLQYTYEQKEMLKKTWTRKIEKRELKEKAMKAEAIDKAKEIADYLKTRYGVKNIYLFGSLAWRKKFSCHSDIDLYIESFPKEICYWEAVAKSEEIAAPYPVTIIMAETANPEMKEKIEREGLLL
jgi:predicted nucleotidyltransferase